MNLNNHCPLNASTYKEQEQFIILCHNEWVFKATLGFRIATATLSTAEEESVVEHYMWRKSSLYSEPFGDLNGKEIQERIYACM